MKIALCLSGHLRLYDGVYEFWKENLLDLHEVDVYMHLWDQLGINNSVNIPNSSGVTDILPIDIEQVEKIWAPKAIVVEEYSKFHPLFETRANIWLQTRDKFNLPDYDRPLANFSMYYKWWACNQLINQDCSYDLVIRSRPDVILGKPLPEEIFDEPTLLYTPEDGSWSGVSDLITIAPPTIMDQWCNIWPLLDRKYVQAVDNKRFETCLHPHFMFVQHISDLKIPHKVLPINGYITRINY